MDRERYEWLNEAMKHYMVDLPDRMKVSGRAGCLFLLRAHH